MWGLIAHMAIVILLYIAQIALIVPQKPAANLQDV